MEPSDLNDTVLRLAALAYLGRHTGVSRMHSESDLRIFFGWCQERELAPLAAGRAQIELYVRWMQEVRRFKPSTVSRRMSVVTGFYRTCVIDRARALAGGVRAAPGGSQRIADTRAYRIFSSRRC